MHVDNKSKDILILGEVATHQLDDTILTAEALCSINFTQPNKRFVLSLYYNVSNSFLSANATNLYQFNATSPEIKYYAFCLVKFSKDFTNNDLGKRWLKWLEFFFSVDFNPFDTNDILDIHKYLMKKTRYGEFLN